MDPTSNGKSFIVFIVLMVVLNKAVLVNINVTLSQSKMNPMIFKTFYIRTFL